MKLALIIILSLLLLKYLIILILNIIGYCKYKDNYEGINKLINIGFNEDVYGFSVFPSILITCVNSYFEIYFKLFKFYIYICYNIKTDEDEDE